MVFEWEIMAAWFLWFLLVLQPFSSVYANTEGIIYFFTAFFVVVFLWF